MQTLAQTLAAGNTSGGTSLEMSGADLDLNDGSGTGGGALQMDSGNIMQCHSINGTGALLLAAGSGPNWEITPNTFTFPGGATYLLLKGSSLYANDGSGSGGGTLRLDGGTFLMCDGSGAGGGSMFLDGAIFDTGQLAGDVPSDQLTPSEWWHIKVEGVDAWVPIYQ